VELDAEFIEYKAEAKASMDVLEKKIDDGIRKLDASIKAMKEESDAMLNAKFEELRQLTAPYVPPILKTYDDLGFSLPKFQDDLSTAIGKNQRSNFIELEDSSSKPVQGKLDHMNDDHNRKLTSFGFGQPTTRVKRETHNKYEHRTRKLKMPLFDGEDAYGWIYRVERYFEIQELPLQEQLRAAALCMEGEALSWYRWSEGQTPFHSRDGFRRRLLIRFQ
ncbi:hypothetical protein Tco_1130678, partial [Tanacetum coccineum]